MKQSEDDVLASGNYYKNQQLSGSSIISWSHSRRFETARKLILIRQPKRLLDYGWETERSCT